MNKINATLRIIRKQKRITQKSMAERLNIARSTYSKLESGNTRIDVAMLTNICRILEVSTTEIIKENGDYTLDSISEELDIMMGIAETSLFEDLHKTVAYDQLTTEQKKKLEEKGFGDRKSYENTPFNGRIFSFGQKEVFRYMMDNCGMEMFFRLKLITTDYWLDKWKDYLEDKKSKHKYFEENGDFPAQDQNHLEIDEKDYFVVVFIDLKFPNNKSKTVQISERDFPNNSDDPDEILDYVILKTDALHGEILCFSVDGYDSVCEIVE
ncbi:helix-turn-helix domain-containing protein [Parvicella tangerina]|uniref:HTH cro/C1-type domain-containing protein n=1 Tax=Parvicella tangerina TaxID=2829795 RepID=A0A916JQH6_9FLAO|nr:helix-turn-helix transcriptional regulator [Parvicella tangerina]CAG5086853.1 hypothetical protein CRYO30217_03307 [Parvicella tangerina]